MLHLRYLPVCCRLCMSLNGHVSRTRWHFGSGSSTVCTSHGTMHSIHWSLASLLPVTGGIPVCVYNHFWLVCDSYLSEHRAFSKRSCGSCNVQLAGLSTPGRTKKPPTLLANAASICSWHRGVCKAVSVMDHDRRLLGLSAVTLVTSASPQAQREV